MDSFSKERRIILAIEAIKNNKNLNYSMATQIYKVPQSTLYYRINGRTLRDDSRNGRQKLTNSEEDAIIQYILDLDKRGFPPRILGVEDMANLLLEKRNGGRIGKLWTARFIARRQELKTRLNRVYNFQRAACENSKLINAWFKLVNNIKAKYGITNNDFYNFNKTGFIIGIIYTLIIITCINR